RRQSSPQMRLAAPPLAGLLDAPPHRRRSIAATAASCVHGGALLGLRSTVGLARQLFLRGLPLRQDTAFNTPCTLYLFIGKARTTTGSLNRARSSSSMAMMNA